MHCTIEPSIEPSILYFGTPVAIISTINEDGTANLSPMSSVWWPGWSCMLGLDATSKSVENMKRSGGGGRRASGSRYGSGTAAGRPPSSRQSMAAGCYRSRPLSGMPS